MTTEPAPAPAAVTIGDTGLTATEHVAYYAQQRIELTERVFRWPIVGGDTSSIPDDSHVPDADQVASNLYELTRLETMRDIWERAAGGDPHPDGGTRGGMDHKQAWKLAVRAALRELRRDTNSSNLAHAQTDRARRTAAHQWLTDMRTHGALDAAMVLELL